MALPARNSALDRIVDYVPNRILKAQELELSLAIQDRADQYGIGSIYRNGGTQNVKVEISGNNVSLSPLDPTKSMLVFLNNRFEVFQPAVFTFAGASDDL